MNNIHIFRGKIHSGKSTRLQQWTDKTDNCLGVITLSISDKKYIMDIGNGEKRMLQIENETHAKDFVKVGNFIFLNDTFDWAKQILLRAHKKKPRWLIIDEIGHLELNGQGFEPVVSQLLPVLDSNLLFVVRERLTKRVINHFNLKDFGKIIISEKLPDGE